MAEELNIIGLDLGTKFGWSVLKFTGSKLLYVNSGSWNFTRGKFEGGGAQLIRLGQEFESLVNSVKGNKIVVYEEVRFHGKFCGVDAAHFYGMLLGKIMEVCEVLGIPYVGIGVSTVKKFAGGHGRMDKPQLRKIVEATFEQKFKSLDQSDVVAVALAYVLKHYEMDNVGR